MTAEATLGRPPTVVATAATASAPLVRFETVQKTYDGRTLVIKDLDLEIAAGEFLTLLGPSGSGKTTTLMMLAGFEMPTHGTITLKGPRGKVVVLDVRNPEQFKVVKQGDQVEVTYTEALALSVEPAPKPAAK